MKRILCYGDSNTFGTVPLTDPAAEGQRYDEHTRWCGVLRDTLGEGWEIIEDGVGGRCTIYGDGEEAYKNGEPTLLPALQAAAPMDAVVIMLGTNDAKRRFNLTPMTIGEGMMQLVRTKKTWLDLYVSMITAMVLGRVVAGLAKAWIFTPGISPFAWVTTSLVAGIPGIIIQLVLMPMVVLALTKAKLIPNRYPKEKTCE